MKLIKICCKFATYTFKILLFLGILSLSTSCSIFEKTNKNKDQEIVKEEVEANVFKKAEQNVAKKGSIFSSGTKNNDGIASINNVIWRASIESLSDIPLIQANYGSGLIITDWYSGDSFSSESIKITIAFKSDKIAVSSFKVESFKRICKSDNSCKIVKLPESFNNKLKNKIVDNARKLSTEKIN